MTNLIMSNETMWTHSAAALDLFSYVHNNVHGTASRHIAGMFRTVLPDHANRPYRAGSRVLVHVTFQHGGQMRQTLNIIIYHKIVARTGTKRVRAFCERRPIRIRAQTCDWITADASAGDIEAMCPNAMTAGMTECCLLDVSTFISESIPPL